MFYRRANIRKPASVVGGARPVNLSLEANRVSAANAFESPVELP